ncbi:MAG: hypothetical protein MJZ73_03255 [Bacteroidaceae bacterium]|nr:hypothetical protein [Bacteroidaceae bacterium]
MDTKRYINSTHNENCRQVFIQTQDPAALLRDFFRDAEDAEFEEVKSGEASVESETPLSIDDKFFKALNAVITDGLIVHSYDYHIIQWVFQEKFSVTFNNGQSFVDYLTSQGITHKLPSADSINKKLSDREGKFPNYTWKNTDHNEEIRRINIAKRFFREMTILR